MTLPDLTCIFKTLWPPYIVFLNLCCLNIFHAYLNKTFNFVYLQTLWTPSILIIWYLFYVETVFKRSCLLINVNNDKTWKMLFIIFNWHIIIFNICYGGSKKTKYHFHVRNTMYKIKSTTFKQSHNWYMFPI